MFHSRTWNNKINRFYERALRIIYSDYKPSFCELLEKEKSFSIHHKNIQSLAIKIYKFLHNLSPCIMNNIFKVNQTISYNLRKKCTSKWKYQFYEILYRDHIFHNSENMVTCSRNNQKKLWHSNLLRRIIGEV